MPLAIQGHFGDALEEAPGVELIEARNQVGQVISPIEGGLAGLQ